MMAEKEKKSAAWPGKRDGAGTVCGCSSGCCALRQGSEARSLCWDLAHQPWELSSRSREDCLLESAVSL